MRPVFREDSPFLARINTSELFVEILSTFLCSFGLLGEAFIDPSSKV
jgi:hypothetical protein